jgi:hypothetical protein
MKNNIETLQSWLKGRGKLTSTPTPVQKQHAKQASQPRFIKGMKR